MCEGKKLIIEYDERQHFSEARKISLEAYKNVQLEYDRNLWIRACEDIQAKDNQPANRDEIRAFYDSVRDIEAAKHGYKLIRIMHGQIDFEQDDAVDKLNSLLNVRNDISVENTEIISSNIAGRCGRDYKVDLKIAMYIQTESYRNKTEFDKAVKCIKKSEADILVFPEDCWVPFDDEIASSDVLKQEDLEILFDRCLDLSEKMGCAVIVSGMDYYNTLFSIYANFNAGDEDTVCSLYIKHTMTDCSAFEVCENYQELANELFTPILLRGYTIGMTICYDCNHAIFSRMYGIQGIDVIINSTGGNVKYDKWYKYNKVRAIENISYTLCTMGGSELKENNNSYVLGFNRKGKLLEPFLLNGESEQVNVPGGIYLYNLKNDDDSEELDRSFGQLSTENKKQDLFIPEGNVDSLLMKSEKVDENLYVYEHSSGNIIFCVTSGDVIFKAEEFLPLIYSEKLEKFKIKSI